MKLLRKLKLWINSLFRKKINYDELRTMAYVQKYLEHRSRENKIFNEELWRQWKNETRK